MPAVRINTGSGSFLIFKRAINDTNAIATVIQSTSDRRAKVTTAPATAPTAAACDALNQRFHQIGPAARTASDPSEVWAICRASGRATDCRAGTAPLWIARQ